MEVGGPQPQQQFAGSNFPTIGANDLDVTKFRIVQRVKETLGDVFRLIDYVGLLLIHVWRTFDFPQIVLDSVLDAVVKPGGLAK